MVRARRLGRWDWRFESSHLDELQGRPRRPAGDCAVPGGNDETPSTPARIETRLGILRGRGRLVRRQRAKLIEAGSIPVVRSKIGAPVAQR